MPYSDPEKRRAADRARYYRKLGREDPHKDGNGSSLVPSNGDSAPSASPSNERIVGFNGHKTNPLDRIRPYGIAIVGLVLVVAAGVGVYKYQYQIKEQLEGLLGFKSEPAQEPTALEQSNQSLSNLLDFADDVMRHAGQA